MVGVCSTEMVRWSTQYSLGRRNCGFTMAVLANGLGDCPILVPSANL